MKIIIIDDSREYMALIRRMLASTIPDVEVTEYDPEQQGKPGADFGWSFYDVLLLDYQLGTVENGLDWLEEFQPALGFPPAILMTGAGDEYVAASAIKRGAYDYLRKPDITSERLANVVRSAHKERQRYRDLFDTTVREKLEHDMSIFRGVRMSRLEKPDGREIGYRFIRLIGQGANSRVYLAERLQDRKTLVLKVIDVRDIKEDRVVQRFIKEAAIISEIQSRYVVRFLDHGFTRDYGYIAMEFFTRGDLKQRLERQPSLDEALAYFLQICFGLESIHAAGIIHRDLKPGNIMFRSDDSLAVSDFGISKRLDETSELTKVGCVLGTPNYLSPEQALGTDVDHRTDFYSAGVMLYEMLTGEKPYKGDSAAAVVYQHIHAPIPALASKLACFQPVINRLLAKLPGDRHSTARDIVNDIRPFVDTLAKSA